MASGRAGFTLIELILVMLIAAAVLAVAAPSLRGFAAGREADDAAASIVTLMSWARMQAVSEGRAYRFHLDAERGEYWLSAREGAVFERPRRGMGRRFELPPGVSASWEAPPDAAARRYVGFEPSGRGQPATIRLVGRRGSVRLVRSAAPMEGFRVIGENEEVSP